MNTTSFHISGFWFHVEWDNEGKNGIDQHGKKWSNKENPTPELKLLIPVCKAYGDSVRLMASLFKLNH